MFRREDYILSTDQMKENDYPLPPEACSDQDSKISEGDGNKTWITTVLFYEIGN